MSEECKQGARGAQRQCMGARGVSSGVQGGWPQCMGHRWGITVSTWGLGGVIAHGRDGAVLGLEEAGSWAVPKASARLMLPCSVVFCEPTPRHGGHRNLQPELCKACWGASTGSQHKPERAALAAPCPVPCLCGQPVACRGRRINPGARDRSPCLLLPLQAVPCLQPEGCPQLGTCTRTFHNKSKHKTTS